MNNQSPKTFMFNKISVALIISLFLPQPSYAAINRDILRGGALGIVQCQHIRGNKTKIVWQVIVNDSNKPINATHFYFQTSDGVLRDIYSVVSPTTNYQTTEIFDGLKQTINISGEAYHISFSGVYRYYLQKPLVVQCD
ncbi:hypothetical protein [Nostoc sp. CCY0012]|uniref:hypothetical protein n=1 Tax=Nostoc sp. CCY0012 TaxID=1056123 RepID=UPI0039C6E01D